MRKIISLVLIFSLLFSVIACSGQGKLINGTPEQGESVVIYTESGQIKEGLFIKIDENQVIYIDKDTHKAETIQKGLIDHINLSDKHYDFEGNPITETDISNERGYGRTMGYGIGGFTLGTAVGFGIGLILQSTSSVAPIYPMAVLALGGGYYFGSMGNSSDVDVAIKSVRDRRFAKTKDKFEKELEQTKKLIEEKKKEKERLQKEIDQKKKDTKKEN